MDTKKPALELSNKILKNIIECGSTIDELYREIRELRVLEDDPSFKAALLNLEHSFYMLVKSFNVLKDEVKNVEISAKKESLF